MTNSQHFLPKDFIETNEGLCFAVVDNVTEKLNGSEKVLCYLRYIKDYSATIPYWQKVGTDQAIAYLTQHHPEYFYYSPRLDANLHAVDNQFIRVHYQPKLRLQQLLSSPSEDAVVKDLYILYDLFQQFCIDTHHFGVTGSMLIGAQRSTSDIDLVCYDRTTFHQALNAVGQMMASGHLSALNRKDWHESYLRRDCALTEQDYIWHEQRKFNKGMINGRKFDISFVSSHTIQTLESYQKLGKVTLQCDITEDIYSFDYPAIFNIAHPTIESIVCFTATYTGQAKVGERVEVSGLLEQSSTGIQRIVVGSTREAVGEYIKVIK